MKVAVSRRTFVGEVLRRKRTNRISL